ncbi:MAG: MGMT family protein [Thermomicrobiales bacterium]|nr:MGMT family protein [Thermomicrobiales bacterium]
MAGTSTPPSDAAEHDLPFADRVYDVVARIPAGRATTYGAIARALGNPRGAREVGWALNSVPEGSTLPCHRVVDREGRLSGGWAFGHPEIMAGRLEDEGIPFLEQYRVDLAACFWDPAAEEDAQQLGLL